MSNYGAEIHFLPLSSGNFQFLHQIKVNLAKVCLLQRCVFSGVPCGDKVGPDVEGLIGQLEEAQDAVGG